MTSSLPGSSQEVTRPGRGIGLEGGGAESWPNVYVIGDEPGAGQVSTDPLDQPFRRDGGQGRGCQDHGAGGERHRGASGEGGERVETSGVGTSR